MAEVKFLKGTEEWQMFQDFWNLCQSVWEPEESDGYWEHAIGQTELFFEKYKTDFAKSLALALLKELEMKCKKRRIKK